MNRLSTATFCMVVALFVLVPGTAVAEGAHNAFSTAGSTIGVSRSAPIIINHTTTKLGLVPRSAIENAKSTLHIAYGHTSHGSQLTDGMNGLIDFPGAPYGGSLYQWNDGGTGGALDLHDYAFPGDLGNPDRIAWANETRDYLDVHSDVNVVIWSWCGQVGGNVDEIAMYLDTMNQLEDEYPGVTFVYMTGHLDGSGAGGTVNQRNEQIRTYCRANDKILYDFADIESYDPDGLTNYMVLYANDNCDYISNGNHNWAIDWQNAHTKNVDWYECYAAHSQPLNGNLKAYAAWWLWARLAGWDGTTPVPAVDTISPVSAARGGPAFTLTVNGTGFIAASTIRWNGEDRPTTFVTPIELTADIPASDIATAGTGGVSVFNPAPGGGSSSGVTFTVTGDNPVPEIGRISPATVAAGGPPFTLTVDGNSFVPGSTVRWNGEDRTTSFVSQTRLTSVIPAADIMSEGTGNVSVFNPAPGGGISVDESLTVSTHVLSASALTPKTGKRGTIVTIRNLAGTGFTPGTTVNLTRAGKVLNMRQVTVVSPTSITGKFRIPVKTPTGRWDVTLTKPDGQVAILPGAFKIRP